MADYATEQEIRNRIGKTTRTDDATLEALATAASRAIDRFYNRPDSYFVADSTATARTYAGSGQAVQRIDDCVSISQVAVKDSVTDDTYTPWTTDDWQAGRGDPVSNPDFNRTPYTWIQCKPGGNYSSFTSGQYRGLKGFSIELDLASHAVPTVQVTAKWGGYASVPSLIKEAACMQVARWYKRFQSAMADSLAAPEFGELIYRQQLDPDVKFILRLGRYGRAAVG